MKRTFFITGTDTGVGKTIVTYALGLAFRKKGYDVGIMKPVQSYGNDAAFLKQKLGVSDRLDEINPYFAKEPLSPHIAFQREKMKVSLPHLLEVHSRLARKHDVLLVEGAGGLMVPLSEECMMIDLIRSLNAEVIVVARLGLGTINHTLLTVQQARHHGLTVAGVIFNSTEKIKPGIAEKTNPEAVRKFGKVKILGILPYLKTFNERSLEKTVKELDLEPLLKAESPKERTKVLTQWDKHFIWHPFTQMKDWNAEDQLIIERAEGNYLYDTAGNKYLDGVSSLWVNVHGHAKKAINDAIHYQVNKLDHSTLLGLSNSPAVELAKELISIAPKGLKKVFYSDSGSTAAEIAIKIAYQYWQNIGRTEKRELVHMENSYHGDTLGSVSVGGIDLFHKVYRGLIFKTRTLAFPDCYRAPRGKKYPDYAFEHVDKFERMVRKDHRKIAALIVEPIVQGAAGMIIWPKGVLKRLNEICRAYDILFIADEVATGFGRTGRMFACEHEGVHPDILCTAKGITGGYLPLAATLTTNLIYEGFVADYKSQKTFFHGHTYTGNPIACAAALANIRVFKEEETLIKLQKKIKFLEEQLSTLRGFPFVGDIRQKGMMAGVELVENIAIKKPFDWEEKVGVRICQKVRERGIILRPLGNVVVLMPPLSITEAEIKYLVDSIKWSIKEILMKERVK